MASTVFIDGEAGTTGLQIKQRLDGHSGIDVVSIDPARRKDADARADLLNGVDAVVLCLPDEAAREAVSLISNPEVRVVDASTAHRIADGWVYGFPEMSSEHRDVIASSKRVSNCGCYATASVALIRPLVDAGVIASNASLSIHGVSGYSGGGRKMIEEFEDSGSPSYTEVPFRMYGLSLQHKHVPEIEKHAGLTRRPIFSPAVGRYAQGMLVTIPLDLSELSGQRNVANIRAVLADAYAGQEFVSVSPAEESEALTTLDPESLNGTNKLYLYVFGAPDGDQVLLTALLDNLGKGASGQAVQNLNIMLGLPEGEGVSVPA